MPWLHDYQPLPWWPASTLAAATPVLALFFVLLVLRHRAWVAALAGAVTAFLLAVLLFGQPAGLALRAAGFGAAYGFLQIAWIIVGALFLYDVAVETGQFQVMKESITALSSDRRLQVILIAFCFGAFLEGASGGGAPVAIAGSFLIGLGFPPFQAALVCLLANTAPVAWGSVGSPVRLLAGVTDLSEPALNAMIGRILPVFSVILPVWIVRSTTTWRRTAEVLPALLVSGLAFAGMQLFWSNFMETGLVDIASGTFALLVMVVFLRFWRPREELPINGAVAVRRHAPLAVLKGWSPFILASALIFAWAVPLKPLLSVPALRAVPVPGLHEAVARVPPVVATPTAERAVLDVNVLALPGTAVFLGAFLSAWLLGLSPRRSLALLGRTVQQLAPSLAAICLMVALAFVTRYAGMDIVLGLSLTHTGWLYPFFGTLLGWLGVGLTGTDGGSNTLFGNLQRVTAEQLGLDPVLMASANSAGGVMGKMIAAQSIVVSSAATRQEGNEAAIFRALFPHSIALVSLVGLLVMVYAYVFPGVVPGR